MSKTQGRVRDISERLSETFQQLVPLHPEQLKGRKQPNAKEIEAVSQRALHQFYEAAHQERLSHNLGVIGRARVAIRLQKQLLNAGYPPALVKQVLFAMLTAAFVGKRQ